MAVCYIGLGSNIGDRNKNIQLAIDKINQLRETKVTKISSIIETIPVGGPAQEKFLNAAIEIETLLSPRELLTHLQKIESALGRVRIVKNGPRTIDLDILFYDDKKIREEDLVVPHPRIKKREFVLNPLKEIAGHIVEKLFNENNN
jgi:dihydroneopterin aldolase/2-amino-4-hydroxy-6-hydroxymethyldihydropteridine diphosphokinase